jgi:hypothetical protein
MKRWWAASLFASAPALAHAHALPVGLELTWPPSGAPIVLTNRGLVFDAQLRCNEAYGVNTSAYPRVWSAATHTLLVTQNSVLRTSDRGCTLTHATGLPDRSLGGFTASSQPVLLVSTLTAELGGGIYASVDDGLSFARWADNEPYEAFRELMFAASDPARVYASGFRVEPSSGKVSYVWAVSRDGGRTFTRTPLDQERLVLATAPDDADVLWAWDAQTGAVYQSRDAGTTFVERLRLAGKPSLALHGRSVWVGAEGSEGVHVSRDEGATFTTVLPELTSVSCLRMRGDALYLCGVRYPVELGVWSLDAAGDGPLREERMFADVRAPVWCAGERDECALPWRDWSLELLTEPTASVDANMAEESVTASDATGVDAGSNASLAASESGCATHAGAGHAWWWMALACLRRRPRA